MGSILRGPKPTELVENPRDYTPEPPGRVLTEVLLRGAEMLTHDRNGTEVSNKELLAKLVWEAVTTGEVHFQGADCIVLAKREWVDTVRFIYNQVDGPPKKAMDLNIKREAERLAKELGLNAEELIARAEEIIKIGE